MIECARYNLNGSADNAFAEALALAHLHRHGDVVPERDLLRCAGFRSASSGHARRARSCSRTGRWRRFRSCARPRRAARAASARSCACASRRFTARCDGCSRAGWAPACARSRSACWLPRKLSNRALAALRARLSQCAAAIDPRFEIVLLAPPADARARIFPPLFGELRRDEAARDQADVGELLGDIRAFCAAWAGSSAAPNERGLAPARLPR